MDFKPFTKIPRLSRDIVVTEKIDGTNAVIYIGDDGEFLTGSRTQWITPEKDNYGFSRWAHDHKSELLLLGAGFHYGEWWGRGIQRGYDLKEKRFSLFNASRWSDDATRPACCGVAPTLYSGPFDLGKVDECLKKLADHGSVAAPGFARPEGVVIYHIAGGYLFKKTIEKDSQHKSEYGG